MKNQQDPLALEDHEYPDWLWSILDKGETASDKVDGEGDLFCMSMSKSILPRQPC